MDIEQQMMQEAERRQIPNFDVVVDKNYTEVTFDLPKDRDGYSETVAGYLTNLCDGYYYNDHRGECKLPRGYIAFLRKLDSINDYNDPY